MHGANPPIHSGISIPGKASARYSEWIEWKIRKDNINESNERFIADICFRLES